MLFDPSRQTLKSHVGSLQLRLEEAGNLLAGLIFGEAPVLFALHKLPLKAHVQVSPTVFGAPAPPFRPSGMNNGAQVHHIAGSAMKRGPSVDFCGYRQRHKAV